MLATFGPMICDGDSHRQAIACKGAGGAVTCHLCKNISADEATVEADAKGYRRLIKEANVDMFHLSSDEAKESFVSVLF